MSFWDSALATPSAGTALNSSAVCPCPGPCGLFPALRQPSKPPPALFCWIFFVDVVITVKMRCLDGEKCKGLSGGWDLFLFGWD